MYKTRVIEIKCSPYMALHTKRGVLISEVYFGMAIFVNRMSFFSRGETHLCQ